MLIYIDATWYIAPREILRIQLSHVSYIHIVYTIVLHIICTGNCSYYHI